MSDDGVVVACLDEASLPASSLLTPHSSSLKEPLIGCLQGS
jgi:hypothetical protein